SWRHRLAVVMGLMLTLATSKGCAGADAVSAPSPVVEQAASAASAMVETANPASLLNLIYCLSCQCLDGACGVLSPLRREGQRRIAEGTEKLEKSPRLSQRSILWQWVIYGEMMT